LIRRLLDAGITIQRTERKEGPLSGKTLVLTGTLSSMTRSEAEERIKALGGAIGSNVGKKTDYLVVGADPGSKLEKAEKLKVPILDETAFLELLGKQSASDRDSPSHLVGEGPGVGCCQTP
jgi:DNA ligase (NAD+)